MSETDIALAMRKALRLAGYIVFRVQSGAKKVGGYWMQFAEAGTPDIVGHTRDGKFIGIEVKDSEGETSSEQDEFLERASACGCRVGVARTVGEALAIASGQKLHQVSDGRRPRKAQTKAVRVRRKGRVVSKPGTGDGGT